MTLFSLLHFDGMQGRQGGVSRVCFMVAFVHFSDCSCWRSVDVGAMFVDSMSVMMASCQSFDILKKF